jgi:hypothetical protein
MFEMKIEKMFHFTYLVILNLKMIICQIFILMIITLKKTHL